MDPNERRILFLDTLLTSILGPNQSDKKLDREAAIAEACSITALVYHSIGDYSHASDGFCAKCAARDFAHLTDYRNAGRTLAYVRLAAVEKLQRDGFRIAQGFDPSTGREMSAIEAELIAGGSEAVPE